jgi:transcriptional regulator with XRE-family HTH domain
VNSVGENIKRFRKEASLTQKELAYEAHVSRSYLADVENGRYNPSLEFVRHIAKALKVGISSIMGELKKSDEMILLYEGSDYMAEATLIEALPSKLLQDAVRDYSKITIERYINTEGKERIALLVPKDEQVLIENFQKDLSDLANSYVESNDALTQRLARQHGIRLPDGSPTYEEEIQMINSESQSKKQY